jgi:hypothetical protein
MDSTTVPAMRPQRSNSYPYWVEILNERVHYHKTHRQTAIDLSDYDSADQHQCVVEELLYILNQVGMEEEEE